MNYLKTDFVVMGTGISGLYSALNLGDIGNVTILTKKHLEDCNTQHAQGGIAVALSKGDSWFLHMKDTLEAGAGLCESKSVEILVKEGQKQVRKLIKMGMKFDHAKGELDFTLEGAHSKRRILHAGGDATGKKVREFLTGLVKKKKNIQIKEETFVIDLVNDENDKIAGVLVWDGIEKEYEIYQASAVVIASGGCGQIYENTTNPDVTTGDGVAMAYKAGSEIMDMEFIQFHPTALYNPGGLSFLISESVRGEGGVLRNEKGERFMLRYHKLAELAPRDVVSRAMLNEIESSNKPYVWMDITHLDSDYVVQRFPTIFNTLQGYGLDMRKEWIPVAPAAHYTMGGIKTDTFGRTNLPGLYACGEAACTDVHGANRLASNSLLEGLVFAYRVYQAIKIEKEAKEANESDLIVPYLKNYGMPSLKLGEIRKELRKRMTEEAGVIRNEKGLKNLLDWLREKSELICDTKNVNEDLWELKNMLNVGKLIVKSALLREESRGTHFRVEYPKQDSKWAYTHIIRTFPGDEENVLE